MLHIASLEKLVHELNRLPGIGPKTAQRLAYYILRSKDAYSDKLSEALLRVKSEVHTCPECYSYTDRDICKFCEDPHRQTESICVVEEPSDISRIEGSGAFRGKYHVLHGVISPLDGISAKHLKIQELINRVDAAAENGQPISEVILALDADLEGDTTALYLAKIFQSKNVRISRIAHGIPMGSDIDFIDDRTMGRALENRVQL
ncbi:MAG: recombination protein RecR [Bdellovibrionaceae bacterium]|nr:recombination protein RecR [Pseudobdellovibrionaceae bacterium]